jgi:hypothetical protein
MQRVRLYGSTHIDVYVFLFVSLYCPGNLHFKGSLSIVDLLIKVACFVRTMFAILKEADMN